MANQYLNSVTPKNLQWWGIGKETTAGTIAAPTMMLPVNNGTPTDQFNPLLDKDLRGDMAEDTNIVVGTEYANFPLSGDVYLDTIGHLFYNLFGEYTAILTTAGTAVGATTVAAAAGATSLTGTSFATGLAVGTLVEVNTASGPTEIVVLSAISTATTLTFTSTPLRFPHAVGATCTSAAAGSSVTHSFHLLNPGGSVATLGLPADCQPITHTISHNNALPANATYNSGYVGVRQYPYWCCSGMDFNLDTNNLFQHNTKGQSILGIDATSAVTQPAQGSISAQANWRFAVGIGGPASGGTLVYNVQQASISPVRELVNKFALANQQAPVAIGRLGVTATGRLTFIAEDESPLLMALAGTQQQLQIAMTNTANLGVTFNFGLAQFEQAQESDPDMMEYNVAFRGLRNTSDAGLSGGKACMSVTLINLTPTY